MNLKALITGLFLLGSSSAAMARPVTVTANAQLSWSYGASGPVIRDHRAPRAPRVLHTRDVRPAPNPGAVCGPAEAPAPEAPPPFVPQWTTLGAVSQIVDGEMPFRVAPQAPYARPYSLLKLQWSAGKTLVYRIQVQYANGRTQVVELNKYLNASTPVLSIDLAHNGSPITGVTVVGRNARQSTFSVLAI